MYNGSPKDAKDQGTLRLGFSAYVWLCFLHKVIYSFSVDMIRLDGLRDDYVSRQALGAYQVVCAVMDPFGVSP